MSEQKSKFISPRVWEPKETGAAWSALQLTIMEELVANQHNLVVFLESIARKDQITLSGLAQEKTLSGTLEKLRETVATGLGHLGPIQLVASLRLTKYKTQLEVMKAAFLEQGAKDNVEKFLRDLAEGGEK